MRWLAAQRIREDVDAMRDRSETIAMALVACWLLAACDWTGTTISGVVRVNGELAPDQAAPIKLLVNDDDRYPMETPGEDWDPTDWGTLVGPAYVVIPSGRMNGLSGSYDGLIYQPGQIEYFYWHSELLYQASEVWVGAFIDLDNNNQLDPGEPWGSFANNPIVDPVGDGDEEAPNEADITIDRIFLPDDPDLLTGTD